jgi:hypothetical protein
MHLPSGETVEVHPQPRSYTANHPCPSILPPGGHHVREVYLLAWEAHRQALREAPWFRILASSARPTVSMAASFSIPVDDDATDLGIWTGRVESPVVEYGLDVSESMLH